MVVVVGYKRKKNDGTNPPVRATATLSDSDSYHAAVLIGHIAGLARPSVRLCLPYWLLARKHKAYKHQN